MSEEIQTTRTELLRLRNQIGLARQGRDLLKKKQDALLLEFMKIMQTVIEARKRLADEALAASQALAVAEAVDGSVTLKSAALAAAGDISVDIERRHIMGIPVPEISADTIHRSAIDRGYGLIGVSSRIDETAERFERYINIIIEVAAVETKLKRLAAEIRKTRCRVNALDQIVLPRLSEDAKAVASALDERGREDLFRLKRVKKSLEKKKAVLLG